MPYKMRIQCNCYIQYENSYYNEKILRYKNLDLWVVPIFLLLGLSSKRIYRKAIFKVMHYAEYY